MNRLMVVALGAVAAFSACDFGVKTCRNGEGCPSGSVCDPGGSGFCVAADGGSGGGGVSGGGGSGGGGGGGGSGGGGGAACVLDACAEGQECSPVGCKNAVIEVVVTMQPMAVSTVAQSVQGRIQRTGMNGDVSGLKLPQTVTLTPDALFSTAPSAAVAADGTFSFLVSAVANGNGPGTVTISFASISRDVAITADTTPPVVDVEVVARPTALADPDPVTPAAWKKDEAALVRVTVTGGRAAVPTDLIVSGGTVSSTTCAGCAGTCQCFAVDLSATVVPGLRGTVNGKVGTIADAVGNQSAEADAGIDVTRVRWERAIQLLSSANTARPVAVSNTGRVVAAVDEAPGGAFRVQAFEPDGGSAWGAIDAGTVAAGPTVGTNQVWVARTVGSTSSLGSIAISSGSENPAACVDVAGLSFANAVALATSDAGVELPVALRNGVLQAAVTGLCPFVSLNPGATDVSAKASIVTLNRSGQIEAFTVNESDSRIWKASLEGTSWTDRGNASLPMATQPKGLFLDGANYVGGGGGVVANLFSGSSPGSLSGTLPNSLSASNVSAPVLGSGFVVYGSASGNVFKATYASGMMSGATLVAGASGNLQSTMPLLGENGLVYLVGSTGRLTVRRVSDLSEVWGGSLGASINQVSELALDVVRNGTARDCSRPLGVLYVVTRSATTATLRSIIVDSKGLDAMAPWPKFQRDNANTGNATASLAPWSCP